MSSSPFRRRHGEHQRQLAELVEPLDVALRNTRVVVRRVAVACYRREPVPASYASLMRDLADLSDRVADELVADRMADGGHRRPHRPRARHGAGRAQRRPVGRGDPGPGALDRRRPAGAVRDGPARGDRRDPAALDARVTTTSSWVPFGGRLADLDGPAEAGRGCRRAPPGVRGVGAVLEQRADDAALGRLVEVAHDRAPAARLVEHAHGRDAAGQVGASAARRRRTSPERRSTSRPVPTAVGDRLAEDLAPGAGDRAECRAATASPESR